jgi:bifunctional UDP-N-acetylglucosamine pyrophosphorylase/glucosamine-1-phosphate N-acetyltransferase
MRVGVVILAAGQGTRMRSALPKVVHLLGGKPLLGHVLDCARALEPSRLAVVYGHGGEQVRASVNGAGVAWVHQAEQLGTGHAVQQALPLMTAVDRVLVLYGDVPLITTETLETLVRAADGRHLALLTITLDDPTGYGRIVRDRAGRITRVVEHKDAGPIERNIKEVNTGIFVAERVCLEDWLGRVGKANAQGEYYLTDVIERAVDDGVEVSALHPMSASEVEGVNDRAQLARLERVLQQSQADALMREGVTLRDPARFDLRGRLVAGRDVQIDINVVLEGEIELGDGVRIGPGSVIRDSRLGPGVEVLEHCVIEGASIGAGSRIGPFARLRPEADLAEQVHIGNFVEIKKSRVDQGSKINHLSYVGDASVGTRVNIGAGTITCNYDGANKHRTVIGNDAFIGSDTQLVAPVTVGEGATIGAGSTITRNAPAGKLTLTRVAQTTIDGWTRPKKRPAEKAKG